ncbi:MAG TPA: CpsD/CapB family tyrosine-protein kinase [Steroidobacteraceae bacterium]|nr:CpsD/CapB family tyrosine-protein kinase [Steroidobacteraceae bacterium]
MSIVEHALEKNRSNQKAGRVAPTRVASEDVDRLNNSGIIDPAVRIRPLRLEIDKPGCRERRVILHDATDTDAAAVAAYRILRTRLLHRIRAKQWTSIAVTSADQNDGKTLTAVNLAISMAREKNREIVLLDLDMRNPSVCRTLGIDPAVELRQYLETGQGGSDVFMSIGIDNLLIAGSVTPITHASELLASTRFDEMLAFIRRGTVDPLILIDLPPVLVTDDALVIAPKIDAFLVVTSEGTTIRADFIKAMGMLQEFPIAGIALNRALEATQGYDYAYSGSSEGARSS